MCPGQESPHQVSLRQMSPPQVFPCHQSPSGVPQPALLRAGDSNAWGGGVGDPRGWHRGARDGRGRGQAGDTSRDAEPALAYPRGIRGESGVGTLVGPRGAWGGAEHGWVRVPTEGVSPSVPHPVSPSPGRSRLPGAFRWGRGGGGGVASGNRVFIGAAGYSPRAAACMAAGGGLPPPPALFTACHPLGTCHPPGTCRSPATRHPGWVPGGGGTERAPFASREWVRWDPPAVPPTPAVLSRRGCRGGEGWATPRLALGRV